MAADESIIAMLQDRDGLTTTVALRDGSVLVVYNIAWGYDEGDEWAHVTSNISPPVEGASVDFFFTSAVLSLSDAETGELVVEK